MRFCLGDCSYACVLHLEGCQQIPKAISGQFSLWFLPYHSMLSNTHTHTKLHPLLCFPSWDFCSLQYTLDYMNIVYVLHTHTVEFSFFHGSKDLVAFLALLTP